MNDTAEAKDIAEAAVEAGLEFPEPILGVIKDAALKKIKKGAGYQCVNGHKFKGKDVVLETEEDGDVLRVTFSCPECGIDKIMIPNPVLVLHMSF